MGERYHAVLTAIKNQVPFVCADYYAKGKLSRLGLPIKSKIFDICLSTKNTKYCKDAFDSFKKISPGSIADLLFSFDTKSNTEFTVLASENVKQTFTSILNSAAK